MDITTWAKIVEIVEMAEIEVCQEPPSKSPSIVDESIRAKSKKKKKKKYPTFWTNLNDYFTEFTAHTTLETFPYLGDQSRSIVEK